MHWGRWQIQIQLGNRRPVPKIPQNILRPKTGGSHLQTQVVNPGFHALLFVMAVTCAFGQEASSSAAPRIAREASAAIGLAGSAEKTSKRAFGIVPNYRSTDVSSPFQSIGTRQKMAIAAKDSFDWSVFVVAGGYAGLGQLANQNPSFKQGVKGYANRYVRTYGDIMIGNFLTEGLMPSLLHEDPRYFRRGQGTFWHRARYAASRILITRTDSGKSRFNFSEVVGSSISAGISNAYYPDTRNASDNFGRLAFQLGTDAFADVLKEFWPDVRNKISNRHHRKQNSSGCPVANFCGVTTSSTGEP